MTREMRNAFMVLVLMLILLSLALLTLFIKMNRLVEDNNLSAKVQQQEVLIANLNCDISNLQLRLQECEGRTVTTYQVLPDAGNKNVAGSSGTNTGSTSSILSPMNTPPAKKETTINKKVSSLTKSAGSSLSNAPSTTTIIVATPPPSSTDLVFPSYFYDAGDKVAKFCVRLDGRSDGYLPHLAINDGRIEPSDPGILANKSGGYDWISDTPLPDFIGDWGVVKSGNSLIFFVSARLIDLYLEPGSDQVEINAPATYNIHKKMTKFEDYYVYYAE